MTTLDKFNKVFVYLGLCKVKTIFHSYYGFSLSEIVEDCDLNFMLRMCDLPDNYMFDDLNVFRRYYRLCDEFSSYHVGLPRA